MAETTEEKLVHLHAAKEELEFKMSIDSLDFHKRQDELSWQIAKLYIKIKELRKGGLCELEASVS